MMFHLITNFATSTTSSLAITGDDLLKLLLAIVCGGIIGVEREYHDKAAGFRTLIFICLGSTLFTLFSEKIAASGGFDPGRITSSIVSGVGFLGAGVILHQKGQLVGLTTAAVVWLVAALGIGIGSGEMGLAVAGTVITMIVLLVFPFIEHRFAPLRDKRIYEIHCDLDSQHMQRLEQLFRDQGMEIHHRKQMKSDNRMVCIWQLIGKTSAHHQLMALLINDPDIHELRL